MAILRYIIPITATLLLAGCEKEFMPKIDSEPVLCVNSLITAGEPIDVNVTHTWVFNDIKGESLHDVTDAKVSIYINGELASEDDIPKEGDHIRIIVHSEEYGDAEASVTVPYSVPVELMDFTIEVVDTIIDADCPMAEDIMFNTKFRIKVYDTNRTDDLFKLNYKKWYNSGDDIVHVEEWNSDYAYVYLYLGAFDYNSEPIFDECLNTYEDIIGDYGDTTPLVFTDRQFVNKDYTLTIRFDRGTFHVDAPEYNSDLYDCGIELSVSTISRSYYDHELNMLQLSKDGISNLANMGLAEQAWGYSNVSTGAGVVAARAVSTITVSFKDFIEQTLHDDRPGGKCRR